MPGHCCDHCEDDRIRPSEGYRKLLWIALAVNFLMFAVEVLSGFRGKSVSLLADSLDFLGDAANYGISLIVLGMSMAVRAQASRLKAASMFAFGIWVLGIACWHFHTGGLPSVTTMSVVGVCALLANAAVAALLFRYREGDSNMRSIWLCTRNDVLGNVAVLLAAFGVFGTGSAWPDLIVAAIMSTLALTSAVHILRQSRAELRDGTNRHPA
ncbi:MULTISPECIES: cation transporter [unclassified Caballeronia]|uniref:cation transporter n=1 Tax=unclassified Caballeronia TaxID=2646786 RepID=UPI002857FC18|nr:MULTISPECIES: cation transporter [unclassified Caballeronia]MDR5777144.1 cation transporter [Caballeronia sp. LZ002]MDR5798700.1 cation transporter [Caballeronia sp. LZ001]MDR5852523.1 cation transporter [Caballeronia sp. LZ003]